LHNPYTYILYSSTFSAGIYGGFTKEDVFGSKLDKAITTLEPNNYQL